MDDKLQSFVFCVYSPRDMPDHTSVYEQLTSVKHEVVFSNLEYGSNHDHPHLNIIYRTTTRPDTLRSALYAKLGIARADIKTERNLIHCKRVTDLTSLIGGYLQKEEDAIVIFVHPTIDLAVMRRKVEERKSDLKPTKGKSLLTPVSEKQVLEMLIVYFQSRDFTSSEYYGFQQHFAQNHFYCSRISWRKLFNWMMLYSDTGYLDRLEMSGDVFEI